MGFHGQVNAPSRKRRRHTCTFVPPSHIDEKPRSFKRRKRHSYRMFLPTERPCPSFDETDKMEDAPSVSSPDHPANNNFENTKKELCFAEQTENVKPEPEPEDKRLATIATMAQQIDPERFYSMCSTLIAYEGEKKNLAEQNEKLRAQVNELNDAISKLDTLHEQEIESKQQELDAAEEKLQDAESRASIADNLAKLAQTELADTENELNNLQQSLDTEKKETERLRGCIAEAEKRRDSWSEEKKEMVEKSNRLQSEVTELNTILNNRNGLHRQQMQQAQDELDRLNRELEAERQENARSNAKVGAAQHKADEVERQRGQTQKERDALKKDLAETKKKYESQLQVARKEQTGKYEELQRQNEQLVKDLESAQSWQADECKRLKQENEQRARDIKKYKQRAETAENNYKLEQKTSQTRLQQVETKNNEIEGLRKTMLQNQQRLARKEDELGASVAHLRIVHASAKYLEFESTYAQDCLKAAKEESDEYDTANILAYLKQGLGALGDGAKTACRDSNQIRPKPTYATRDYVEGVFGEDTSVTERVLKIYQADPDNRMEVLVDGKMLLRPFVKPPIKKAKVVLDKPLVESTTTIEATHLSRKQWCLGSIDFSQEDLKKPDENNVFEFSLEDEVVEDDELPENESQENEGQNNEAQSNEEQETEEMEPARRSSGAHPAVPEFMQGAKLIRTGDSGSPAPADSTRSTETVPKPSSDHPAKDHVLQPIEIPKPPADPERSSLPTPAPSEVPSPRDSILDTPRSPVDGPPMFHKIPKRPSLQEPATGSKSAPEQPRESVKRPAPQQPSEDPRSPKRHAASDAIHRAPKQPRNFDARREEERNRSYRPNYDDHRRASYENHRHDPRYMARYDGARDDERRRDSRRDDERTQDPWGRRW